MSTTIFCDICGRPCGDGYLRVRLLDGDQAAGEDPIRTYDVCTPRRDGDPGCHERMGKALEDLRGRVREQLQVAA